MANRDISDIDLPEKLVDSAWFVFAGVEWGLQRREHDVVSVYTFIKHDYVPVGDLLFAAGAPHEFYAGRSSRIPIGADWRADLKDILKLWIARQPPFEKVP